MPTCKDCEKRHPQRKNEEGHYCIYLEIFVPDDEDVEGCDGFFAGMFDTSPPVCPDCGGEGEIDSDEWDEYSGHKSVGRRCPTCNGGEEKDECVIEDE